MNWKNYFFTANFTDAADYLKTKTVGHMFHGVDADILSQLLERHDRRKKQSNWNADNHECHFNVVGATVTYNGPNNPSFKSNSKYTHILVLKFPPNNFYPQDEITLQYNEV